MEETQEPTEVQEEKKQVKFSDNSKQTTYEKDQDVLDTTDDEEGTKSTANSNIGEEKSKTGAEEILSSNIETDEEKLQRLGKKYEINTEQPNNSVDLKEDNLSVNNEQQSAKEEAKSENVPEQRKAQDVMTSNGNETTKDNEKSNNESNKSYQPTPMSYSLISRGQQPQVKIADDTTVKNDLQLTAGSHNTAIPSDSQLREGQEGDRNVERDKTSGDGDIANQTDEAKVDKNDQQNATDKLEQQKNKEELEVRETEEELYQEKAEDKTSEKATDNLEEDNENPKINTAGVKPTPVKENVKLDLSKNTNNGSASQRSNGRNSAHIKTDFRGRRPIQTTSTKITVPTGNKSDEKSSTNRPSTTKRSLSPREIAAQERAERQRKAQSARPSTRVPETARSVTSGTSSRSSRPPSRPRSCGYESERRRMKEFFQAELRRLKQSLGNEAKKFKRPKVRDHYPDVYTPLDPYCSTHEATFLINMPVYGYREKQASDLSKSTEKKESEELHEDDELMFTTRSTAIRLCDPWDSLNMDRNVLPKLETAELRQRRMDQMRVTPKPKSPRTKRPEAKQGSTRLPKFPVITSPNQDLTKKELYYGDVPMLRDELMRNYSHNGEERKKSDYKRTKQDFFRMELDRVNDYHKISRPHMRAAYFAYLQNTPGSRKALMDCMKEIREKKGDQTPQAVA